jgi:uncharacterized coiled-coil protein SlyX
MAKKIEPVTVAAPSAAETIGVGTGATAKMGGAAAETNVGGRLTQLQGLLGLLTSGGAYALDPQLRTQFESLQKSVAGATRGATGQINKLNTQITNAQSEITRLEGKEARTKQEQAALDRAKKTLTTAQTKLEPLQARVAAQNQRITDFQNNQIAGAPKATDALRDAFPELAQTLDDAEPYLQKQGQLGAAGERLMDTLGQGFQSREIGRGEAGEALYGRATQMASSDGRLSPEANRDAVQSARQAFAARGLGTSAGSAAAELLNRDQYSRQRMFQDLGFANQISQQDQTRMFANEENRRLGNQMNVGMLGQAFTTQKMLEQEGLGAALQRGQLRSAANPANMLLGMYGSGEPTGSQALPGAASMANNWATNALNASMFNANSQMWADAANKYGQYGPQQSGMGSTIGGIAGGLLGGATGYFASGGNPMFAMGGYMAGSQIGSGVGGSFR